MTIAISPAGIQPAPFLVALQEIAGKVSGQEALRFKARGRWVSLNWRDVAVEVDRLASGLQHLGLTSGTTVAVEGTITPRLLLTALAVRVLDGRLVNIPDRSSRDERERLVEERSVRLVLVQGRLAAEIWSGIAARQTHFLVLLDHATAAAGRSPGEGIVTLSQLGQLAPATGWSAGIAAAGSAQVGKSIWLEETTNLPNGLETILSIWLQRGESIVLPEVAAAADRDRAESRPTGWIASGDTLDRVAAGIRDQLPLATTTSGRLVAAVLRRPKGPIARLVIARLRRQFGFARLASVELADKGSTVGHEARSLLAALGVPVVGRGSQGRAATTELAAASAKGPVSAGAGL